MWCKVITYRAWKVSSKGGRATVHNAVWTGLCLKIVCSRFLITLIMDWFGFPGEFPCGPGKVRDDDNRRNKAQADSGEENELLSLLNWSVDLTKINKYVEKNLFQ